MKFNFRIVTIVAFFVLFVVFGSIWVRDVFGATQTINTIPSGTASFLTDLQTFLGDEAAERSVSGGNSEGILGGGIGPTDAGLSHTITAVTGYVNGFYVYQASVSHTYTATSRTYVYIRDSDSRTVTISGATVTYDGYFVFAELPASTAAPISTDGITPLFYADMDGTGITTVTDSRSGQAPLSYWTTFSAAITAISSIDFTLIVNKSDTLTASVATNVNTRLVWLPGNVVTLGAYNFTSNGGLRADRSQLFNAASSGAVIFSGNNTHAETTVFPEWWGIDWTADEVQINLALASITNGGVVKLAAKRYDIAAPITLGSNDHLVGTLTGPPGTVSADATNIINSFNTVIALEANSNCDMITVANDVLCASVKDLVLDGNSANNAGTLNGIKLTAAATNQASSFVISNVGVYEVNGHGIFIDDYRNWGKISNVDIAWCDLDGIQFNDCRYWTVSNLRSGNNGENALAVVGTAAIGAKILTFNDCELHDSGSSETGEGTMSGISIEAEVESIQFNDTQVYGNHGNGIYFYGVGGTPKHVEFNGGSVFDNSEVGANTYSNIKFYSTSGVALARCSFVGLRLGTDYPSADSVKYGIEDDGDSASQANILSGCMFTGGSYGTGTITAAMIDNWAISNTTFDGDNLVAIKRYIKAEDINVVPATPTAGDIYVDTATRKRVLTYGLDGHTLQWRAKDTWSYAYKTASYVATLADTLILVTVGTGNKTVTLPAISTVTTGKIYIIAKLDASGDQLIIAPDGGDGNIINGAASVNTVVRYEGILVFFTGTSWFAMELSAI